MNEALAEPLSGYEVLVLFLTMAATTAGLVRAYVAHRTQLHQEREASTRAAARVTGLIRLAEANHDAVRIVERDLDGHREVELGGRRMQRCDVSREAA